MSKIITISHRHKSRIYKICNYINDRIYVGSTNNLYGRKLNHVGKLRRNMHHSKTLQRFVNKYGIDKLRFEFICLTSNTTDIYKLEEYWISLLNPFYNSVKIPLQPGEHYVSQEIRNKISKGLTGFKRPKKTQEHIDNHRKTIEKTVIQFAKDGSFIKLHESLTKASEETGISLTKISECRNNKRKSAGGYMWKKESKQLKLF